MDFDAEPSHKVRNLFVALLCIALCGGAGYGIAYYYHGSRMPQPRFDVEALADSLNVDSVVVADVADAIGFQNEDDVYRYLLGRVFANKGNGVTVRVDRDGIYGNGEKLAADPEVQNIEHNSAQIVSGRYRLLLDRTKGTITDSYDNVTYKQR